MQDSESDKHESKRRKVDKAESEHDKDALEERSEQFGLFSEALKADLTDPRFASHVYYVFHGLMNGVPIEELRGHCDELTDKYNLSAKKRVSDELLDNLDGTLVPICAIMGGIVSQEIIKIVSKKDPPLVNTFFYDGLSGTGSIEKLVV